ncbi:hypothetical protein T4B_6446 [Trichinella pseudospiralis]|uniref:Uncharacterized protein n=1 Tax=Trichinella pseudospiralis TaxID=6337 RepID=A0A0V1GUY3_TRIPS|nr:hypothetical protein T4B_6446 [Trichinella pseudospiralis]
MVGSVGRQKTVLSRKERVKRRGKYSTERAKLLAICWIEHGTEAVKRGEMVKDFVLTKLRLCEKAACTLCGSIEQNPWEKAAINGHSWGQSTTS